MLRTGRWASMLLAAGAVLVGAGCGEDDDGASTGTAGSEAATTVSVQDVEGAGEVLVDGDGRALYVAEQEEDGTVRCVRACADIWLPVGAPAGGDPSGPGEVADRLSVVERPDGARQVALDGAPLYRFAQDPGPGEVTGDGLSDAFGGDTFTWHVAAASDGDDGAEEPAGGAPGY